jgi:hypothetical protein
LPFVKDNEALAYKTLVSWNMLGVVSRELKNGRPLLEQDTALLASIAASPVDILAMGDRDLLKKAHELARAAAHRIRTQKSLPGRDEWQATKEMLKHNLQISNPRYGVE